MFEVNHQLCKVDLQIKIGIGKDFYSFNIQSSQLSKSHNMEVFDMEFAVAQQTRHS